MQAWLLTWQARKTFRKLLINLMSNNEIPNNQTFISTRSHPTSSALSQVLLPTLATLNNLSFYPIILCGDIYDNLKYFVTSSSSSSCDQLVAVEAIRVMGNLSRDGLAFMSLLDALAVLLGDKIPRAVV